MVEWEEDLPPPVKAWFMDVHLRAQGVLPTDTTVIFKIEEVIYTVVISRREQKK